MKFSFSIDQWELKAPFVTSTEEIFSIETLTVYLEAGQHVGRGEALGVDYLGETAQSISHQVMSIHREIEAGINRRDLLQLLPPGGARNALDCALWDLQCKDAQQRVWTQAGLKEPSPVQTVYTLSLGSPGAMAREARAHREFPKLKLKLNAEDTLTRLNAVHEARPEAELLIDANGGWTHDLLLSLGDALPDLGVSMVEQPLPRGSDESLIGLNYPVPLVADESCQDLRELELIRDRYQGINIKLDKCGGLTEALIMLERAKALGMDTMVGNMLGSSLAMAPAFLIAQSCRWIDLDGPLWQRADREHPLRYERGRVFAPGNQLWG